LFLEISGNNVRIVMKPLVRPRWSTILLALLVLAGILARGGAPVQMPTAAAESTLANMAICHVEDTGSPAHQDEAPADCQHCPLCHIAHGSHLALLPQGTLLPAWRVADARPAASFHNAARPRAPPAAAYWSRGPPNSLTSA
jgi:hypothetical protein